MGVAIAEKLPDIDKGSSKISPEIGTCIEFTIGNFTAKSMILGKQRCICQKDALKYQISYSLKLTPQILLIPMRTQEALGLCYANKSYFLFECHARMRNLTRSEQAAAKAIVINFRGEDPLEQATKILLRLINGAEVNCSQESIQIIPFRIELSRGSSQTPPITSVARPVLQFLSQIARYRGGTGRRHQADHIYGSAAGVQCTAIAATACAYALVKDPNQWNADDLDRIMEVGTNFYEYCTKLRQITHRFLAASEVKGVVTFPNTKSFDINPATGNRVKAAFITSDEKLATTFPIMKNILTELQDENFVILIARGNSTAIINVGKYICLTRMRGTAMALPIQMGHAVC